MSKHTPGPWGQLGVTVRSCGHIGDQRHICHAGYVGIPSSDEDTANARLIAAAPELLEALEDIEAYESVEVVKDEFAYDRLITSIKAHARAAIAKAKGEA